MDAIYSPPHLALFFGGLLSCSTGIRSMWAKQDIALDFKRFLPVSVSTTLFIGVAGFITMYLSAFMTNVTPTSDFVHDYQTHFKDDFTDQSISLNARADRLRRQPVAVLLLLGQPRHGVDDHHDAGAVRADPAQPAPLAGAVRRHDDDLHRLRPAREHHDRVPRHRPDHPADRHRARDRRDGGRLGGAREDGRAHARRHPRRSARSRR